MPRLEIPGSQTPPLTGAFDVTPYQCRRDRPDQDLNGLVETFGRVSFSSSRCLRSSSGSSREPADLMTFRTLSDQAVSRRAWL